MICLFNYFFSATVIQFSNALERQKRTNQNLGAQFILCNFVTREFVLLDIYPVL